MDRLGIRRRDGQRHLVLERRNQHLRRKRVILVGARKRQSDGLDIGHVGLWRPAGLRGVRHLLEDVGCQRLAGFPAVEGVRVTAHQRGKSIAVDRNLEMHRRREMAAKR